MQLCKCSIIFAFLVVTKNSLKKSPSICYIPTYKACFKILLMCLPLPGLKFSYIHITISSLLPIVLPCSWLGKRSGPAGGGLLHLCSLLWGLLGKNSKSTVSICSWLRLVEFITSTKKLVWSSSACPGQAGRMGDPGGFLLLP